MSKVVMISVLIMTIVGPVLASRESAAPRGLNKTVRWMLIFLAIWVFSLDVLYGRLF